MAPESPNCIHKCYTDMVEVHKQGWHTADLIINQHSGQHLFREQCNNPIIESNSMLLLVLSPPSVSCMQLPDALDSHTAASQIQWGV